MTRLCAEELFPACSPSLLQTGPAIRMPADLAKHVLVHDRSRKHWHDWPAAFRIAPPANERGPVFDQTALAIDAALAGQGIALARSALASLDLISGRLVRPLREMLPAAFAYWIVCRKSAANAPKISQFRSWLVAQVERRQGGAAAKINPSRHSPGSRPGSFLGMIFLMLRRREAPSRSIRRACRAAQSRRSVLASPPQKNKAHRRGGAGGGWFRDRHSLETAASGARKPSAYRVETGGDRGVKVGPAASAPRTIRATRRRRVLDRRYLLTIASNEHFFSL